MMESLRKLGERLLSTILPPEALIQINPIIGPPRIPSSSKPYNSGHVKEPPDFYNHINGTSTSQSLVPAGTPITRSVYRPHIQANICTVSSTATSDLPTSTISLSEPNQGPNINIDLITHVPNQHLLADWTRAADLTRDYEVIHPDLSTKTVEPRPEHAPTVSPTEMQKFGANRTLLVQVAARNDYWWGERSAASKGEVRGKDAETGYEEWKRDVKDDMFMLINEVADTGAGRAKIKPFWERCAVKLREAEDKGTGVGMSEVQSIIVETLEEMQMTFKCGGGRFKALTGLTGLQPGVDSDGVMEVAEQDGNASGTVGWAE